PAVVDAITRLRSQPTDEQAEHDVAHALQQTDELLVPLETFSSSDQITCKSVAAPIFDPIGRVLLSLGVTGPDDPVRVDEVLTLGRRLARAAAVATRHGGGRVETVGPAASSTVR